jgi:hypothetical protein
VRDVPSPVVDVVAILLPPLAVAVALVALGAALGRRRLTPLVLAASTLLAGAAAVLGPWRPADAGRVEGGLVVAGANVDGGGGPLAAMRPVGADLWVVGEVSRAVEDELGAAYPHRDGGGEAPHVAVFSRFPLRLLEEAGPDLPGQRYEVAGPDGPFVLYALHVPRPWVLGESGGDYQVGVDEHQRIVERVAARVAGETLPAVVVGDLNSTDRGRDYRALTRATVDAMADTTGGPTSVGKWRLLLARIDHVLVTPGWCGDDARRVGMPGSSHRLVTARVGPCR